MSEFIHGKLNQCFWLVSQSDAILCLGVKFNLIDSKGDREDVKMRTSSSTDRVEQTVSSVLGSKFLSGMCRIQIDLTKAVNKNQLASVTGLISKAPSITNNQAMARELQFFSINNRPVELPKVSRQLNELWRNLDSGQRKRPACVLQFSLPRSAFDVNLSPDKRDVMLTDQDAICDLVRDYVQQTWASQSEGTFQKAQVVLEEPAATFMDGPERRRQVQRRMAFVHDFNTAKLQHEKAHNSIPEMTEQPAPIPSTLPLDDKPTDAERSRWTNTQQSFQSTDDTFSVVKSVVPPITPEGNPPSGRVEALSSKTKMTLHDFAFETVTSNKKKTKETCPVVVTKRDSNSVLEDRGQQEGANASAAKADIRARLDRLRKRFLPDDECTMQSPQKTQRREEPPPFPNQEPKPAVDTLQEKDKEIGESTTEREIPDEVTWKTFDGTDAVIKAAKSTRLEQYQARAELKLLKTTRNEKRKNNTSTHTDHDIESVQASNDNDQQRRSLQLCKADFGEMQILGQFNLGFILCKSKQDHHLWILDQHACDEKYNFEALCRDTKLQEQRLIQPMPLELSPSEETCILEYRDTFAANGFRFEYNKDNPPRHRFSLTTLPHSGARDGCKVVQFNKEDVSSLCAVLGAEGVSYSQDGGTGVDGTGLYGNNAVRRYANASGLSQNTNRVLARLPKAIAMFANRACRGSIMIGTALNQTEMEMIVQRLTDVDQPWNCPHGRPTIRHAADLLPALAQDHDRLTEQVAGPSFSVMTHLSQSQDFDGSRL